MTQHHEPRAAASSDVLRRSMVGLDHSGIMGVELMSAIAVWTGLGWLADRWLGTTPWLLVVGGLVGNFAGLYLIYLRSGRMDDAERRATAERHARPLVVTDPVGAVASAIVAGRTGIPSLRPGVDAVTPRTTPGMPEGRTAPEGQPVAR